MSSPDTTPPLKRRLRKRKQTREDSALGLESGFMETQSKKSKRGSVSDLTKKASGEVQDVETQSSPKASPVKKKSMFRQASKASESEKNATDAHFGQGPAEAPAKSSSGTTNTKSAQKVQPVGVMASAFTPDRATKNATQQLLQLYKSLDGKCEDDGFSVEPVDDNMYKWHVKLFGFDLASQLFSDLLDYSEVKRGRDHVLMELIFQADFPHSPPFMRVIYPRFHQYTGHITIGGSICVKELTRSGWNPQVELAPLIIMVRNLLLEGGALIDMDNLSDYSEWEAKDAFTRVAMAHGWQ